MDIYFSLPNFFTFFHINNIFASLNRAHREYFKGAGKYTIIFSSAHGNFPYCSWNGGVNNCEGKGAYYKDFIECGDRSILPLRFNCSNILLKDYDYANVMGNLILKQNENGSNYIEISDLLFFEYLKEKYPNYKYIFSASANLINPVNKDILSCLIDSNNFDLIELPYGFEVESLDGIKKSSLEIYVNSLCPTTCPYWENCRLNEHNNQYNFSQKTIFNCNNRKLYYNENNFIPFEDVIELYVKKGISHFKMENIPFCDSIDAKFDHAYIDFLIKYFIKEEHQAEALNFVLAEENNYNGN